MSLVSLMRLYFFKWQMLARLLLITSFIRKFLFQHFSSMRYTQIFDTEVRLLYFGSSIMGETQTQQQRLATIELFRKLR